MKDNIKTVKENEESIQQDKYTKHNLLNSKRYIKQKDLINALLEDDRKYTLQEVDSIINKYLKGVIK